MIRTIRAEDNLSSGEIEKIINTSDEFDTVAFEGLFHFDKTNKRFYMFGKGSAQSLIMVTKPNLRLDFSKAKIVCNMNMLTCKTAFLSLFQTARNVRITGLDLLISYAGENAAPELYGLFNRGHSLTVEGSKIEIYSTAQINAAGIANYGGLDTHLDTQADNLSVTNSRIRVHIQPEKVDSPSCAFGIHNYYANSLQLADTYIEVKNRGNGPEQRAVGVYNNGRFCRFSNNNIRANASHNKGLSLEEAQACGMIDEGLYSLISNCNIVGEWGGSCIGLLLKGGFSKATGCKILSTHTIKGTTVRIEGNRIILSDNILTSTSRNARIISSNGYALTITGNLMEVLMNPADCVTGVGAYFEHCRDVIFNQNQLRSLKTCGLFLKDSTVAARDNLFSKEGREDDFAETVKDRTDIETLLDENMISSISM